MAVGEVVVDSHALGVQQTQGLLEVSSKLEELRSSVLELDEKDAYEDGVDDDSFAKTHHVVVAPLAVVEHAYKNYPNVVDVS